MIFLSAGHSTIDSGATTMVRDVAGKPTIRKEADVVEEFRNIVSFILRNANVEHKADGVGDQNLPLSDTVKLIGKNRPALEFHCNAAPPPEPKLVNGKMVTPAPAGGVETLSAPKDLVLGASICKAISDALGIKNRGAKPENSGQHHRLAFVQAGGIIVELFFISSPTDLAAYDAKKWLAARAVANVLMGITP